VISAVYRSWAHVDPETAFAEVKRLGAPVQRELAVDAVTLGWDESGHPGLLEYVRALEAGVERQRPAEVIARRRVATLGAEGAIAWLDSLPDDGFTFILRNRVASAAAETDPAAAAAWAEPRIAAAERPTGLPRRIGTRWVRSDGRAAMKWLASLPAGKDRNDGVAESFRDWMKIDPEDARAWAAERIAEEPLEAWSEPALSVHSRLISRAEPEAAKCESGTATREGRFGCPTRPCPESNLRAPAPRSNPRTRATRLRRRGQPVGGVDPVPAGASTGSPSTGLSGAIFS
jgi:hypothetical protein